MTTRTLFRSGGFLTWAALTLAALIVFALWTRVTPDPQPAKAGAPVPTSEAQPHTKQQLPLPPADAARDPATSNDESKQPPPVTPFHASLAQRATDQQRIRDDPNLPLLAQELAARAVAGDIDAARALADLFLLCAAAASMGPDSDTGEWRLLAIWGDLDASTVGAMRLQFAAEQQRCAALGTSDLEELDRASMSWMQLAAERGDPVATLSRWTASPTAADQAAADQARRQAAVEILQEGDPQNLARHARQLALLSGLASEAYVLAACQMIEACAVDPPAYALQRLSVQSLAGTDGAYLLLRMMTPRQRQIASGQAALILRLWRSRQFEQLVAPQLPPPRRPGAR